MSQVRILVHVPLPETDTTETFWNFWKIANKGFPLADVPPGRVDQQRNFALELLRASDGTHLLNLDHDHYHPIDIVERLGARVIEDPSRLVVAALMYSRHDREICATVINNGDYRKVSREEAAQSGGLMEVASVSAAAMLISREIVDRIPGPWFAYTYPFHENGQLIHPGTDYYFCQLMRNHGIKMWLDTTIVSPHIVRDVVPKEDGDE